MFSFWQIPRWRRDLFLFVLGAAGAAVLSLSGVFKTGRVGPAGVDYDDVVVAAEVADTVRRPSSVPAPRESSQNASSVHGGLSLPVKGLESHGQDNLGAGGEGSTAAFLPLSVLVSAVRDGSLSALQRIRESDLREHPEYDTVVLPVLKKNALETLLERFSLEDWKDWPRASYLFDGTPTLARRYLNNVLTVHEPLGNFLETAALIFHRLWKAIDRGTTYSLESDFALIESRAEEMLSYRHSPAVPARRVLDSSILFDQQFREVFGAVEADLIADYMTNNVLDVEQNIELARGVTPEHMGEAFPAALAAALNRLSLASGRWVRERILNEELKTNKLESLAAENVTLRRALAQLLVIGALDAIDSGDFSRAERCLEASHRSSSGLPSQARVAEYLRSEREKHQAETAQAEAVMPEEGEGKSTGGSSPVASVFIVLFAVLMGVVSVRLWRRFRRVQRVIGEPFRSDRGLSPAGESRSFTRPDELVLDDMISPLRREEREVAN